MVLESQLKDAAEVNLRLLNEMDGKAEELAKYKQKYKSGLNSEQVWTLQFHVLTLEARAVREL
jgi:hypothetical protein